MALVCRKLVVRNLAAHGGSTRAAHDLNKTLTSNRGTPTDVRIEAMQGLLRDRHPEVFALLNSPESIKDLRLKAQSDWPKAPAWETLVTNDTTKWVSVGLERLPCVWMPEIAFAWPCCGITGRKCRFANWHEGGCLPCMQAPTDSGSCA